ncbi:MAG TPA: Rap1a/Tai family immunity protein [Candidatus Acidoferrum sp.]|nr:Rap1a/Tai family immunity protein [Candidatus Acidoferrum sp.]
MRLLLIAGLVGGFFVGLPASSSPRTTAEQADISRSGREFSEVCATVGNDVGSGGGAGGEGSRDAARAARDATCLGWVAGFTEGFLVHDELLGIPKRDRLACVPNGESAMQIVRVMKRYLEKNPEKAHRATRYIASLALAGAFPCRGGK